jgi:cytochrome c biogenesis protein CcmG, thiol:disulfide interchange protein DsbE
MSEYTEPAGGGPPAGDVTDEPIAARRPRRGSRKVIGPFTVRHLAIVNTIIAVALLVLIAVTRPLGASNSSSLVDPQATFYRVSSETQGLEIGQQAPDFVGTGENGQAIRLTDLDGNPLSIGDLKGRPVWINFWATWCPPCQKETPDLRNAYEAHRKDGLVVVAVSIQEEPGAVRDYVTRYGLTYTIGMDVTGAIMHTYRVFGIPTHYFIDRTGVIRDRVFGPLDAAGMEQRLAKILKP